MDHDRHGSQSKNPQIDVEEHAGYGDMRGSHAMHGSASQSMEPAGPDGVHAENAMSGAASEPSQHAGHTMDSSSKGDHSGHKGHGVHGVDHTGHEIMFRNRFWICLALSVPVVLYSPMLQEWFNFSMPVFPGSNWVAPVFAALVFIIGGVPFLRMAVPELRNRQPGMMTLISLAIAVSFFYSLAALVVAPGSGFFWELVTLIDIMLLGHWLEMRSVRQASGALNELAKLMPDTAERVRSDGSIESVPTGSLQAGDLVLIRPGASVPADGEVTEGTSDVNEAMITGESRPVNKEPGDRVIAGSINGSGSLRVRITATGDQTALAGIMRLVEDAQQSKSRTQILADKAAGWLFYIALGAALVTAVAWIAATGFSVEAAERVATVLVIACPHALGLAIPLVVAISTSMAARNGILVRDRLALEQAREVDTVIFDKTGTLTKGDFGVVGMAAANGVEPDEALALTAAVEGDSEHIIARAIRRAAEEKGLDLPAIDDFEAIKGRGVRAVAGGHAVYVGGPQLLEMLELKPDASLGSFAGEAGSKGQTVVYLVDDGKVRAAFALADAIRPESKQAVDRLHELGVQVVMLTGDSKPVAAAVADELGIDSYIAEVLPENKDEKVAALQAEGRMVAMVGDGVNDAPALTRADVGIAIGSGTDVAIESAGIILVKSNPLDVVKIFDLSRSSYGKMRQNLFWAAGYNVVAIPLAAGVLYPSFGILLSPAVGAILMSLSTIIVAINAQTLRSAQLGAGA